jgi:hypothetical protein
MREKICQGKECDPKSVPSESSNRNPFRTRVHPTLL